MNAQRKTSCGFEPVLVDSGWFRRILAVPSPHAKFIFILPDFSRTWKLPTLPGPEEKLVRRASSFGGRARMFINVFDFSVIKSNTRIFRDMFLRFAFSSGYFLEAGMVHKRPVWFK